MKKQMGALLYCGISFYRVKLTCNVSRHVLGFDALLESERRMQMLKEIINESLRDAALSEEEITGLFRIPLFSRESAMILSAARTKSERVSNGLAGGSC
jgi:hypothetical protein